MASCMQIDKAIIPAGEKLRAQNDPKSLYSGSGLCKTGAICGVSMASLDSHGRTCSAPLVGMIRLKDNDPVN